MERGFTGNAALSYVTMVSNAMDRAENATQNTASNVNIIGQTTSDRIITSNAQLEGNPSTQRIVTSAARNVASTANKIGTRPQRLPFSMDRQHTGNHLTGVGNFTNVVMSINEYAAVMKQFQSTYDRISQCIYDTIMEIEEMCRTIFIMPNVGPRCLRVTDTVKSCLAPMRELADTITAQMRKFTHELDEIGG